MSTFYEYRMLNLFEKYNLTPNAVKILKAYEDYKTRRSHEVEFGRLIRLSPNYRDSISDLILTCVDQMAKNPAESKHCLSIISSCAEMLKIADKEAQTDGFPAFKQLPPEVRQRVYDYYLGNGDDADVVVPHPKKGGCACFKFEPSVKYQTMDIALGFTSKLMSQELLKQFYTKRTFFFPCACEMHHHLTTNPLLRRCIRDIKVHWNGDKADVAFKELQKIRKIWSLVVVVSKATTRNLCAREQEVRRHFSGNKRNAAPALPDALGFAELAELRAVGEFSVEHINRRQADRRTDDEANGLENYMRPKVTRAREGEEEDDDE